MSGGLAPMLAAEAEINVVAVSAALIAAVGLILLNGFYVAYEFAILAAKRSSFEDEGRARLSSRLARDSLADVSMQLAGAQLGITIASLALGRISEPALEVLIERALGETFSPEVTVAIGITLSLTVFTVLHLIFGEMVPKNIALVAPDATVRWLVLPYRFYLFLFRPVVQFLNGIANVASRAVGIEPRDELKSVHTASELAAIVAHSQAGGAIDEDDADILRGVLEFAQRPVGEIATPLPEHPSVFLGATLGQLERAAGATDGSRILVLDPGGDTPVGYIHVRDLLSIDPAGRTTPMPSALVRNMAVVDAELPLIEVLLRLRRLRRHLALVGSADRPIGVVSQEEVARAVIQPSEPPPPEDEHDGPAAVASPTPGDPD
ncbi:MAG: CNNM domain-containing protein [Actinomycetota bacterium]